MADRPLTPKQKRFVEEYAVDFNAAAAARRAGYSEKAAKEQGARLLTYANVQAELALHRESKANDLGLSADRTLEETAAIAYADPGEVFDFTGEELRLRPVREIPERARRAIASIKVTREKVTRQAAGGEVIEETTRTEVRFWDKNSALDKAGRRHNLFPSRHEHTGKDGGPIDFSGLSDAELDRRIRESKERLAGEKGGGTRPAADAGGEEGEAGAR